MFYTDQEGGLQVIYSEGSGSWSRADPSTIASDVHPGSPVTASIISDYVYIFYVDLNNTIQGLYGAPSSTSTNWIVHPIASQELQTSDGLFIRTCVTTDNSTKTSMYLYYVDQHNVVQKYAFTGYPALEMMRMEDLPNLIGTREIECQFAGGVETLWTLNEASRLTSWYRPEATKGEWTKGYTSTETALEASSILSISDTTTNRTHIVFQNTQQRMQQYDFDGFGAFQTLVGNTIHSEVTSGTRLTTWANNGYCGESVNIYYQMGNTSDLYYSAFRDQYSSSYYYNYGSTGAPTYTTEDTVMPLVRTYGKNAGKKKHVGKTLKIVIIVVVVIISLFILCCCCGLCA
ncbi:hypothetical protein K458DRAFT_435305 [Lentithecium fluviatile CBS 122367]|uniref:Fucose-specific lectin n=1 Tax=Lentithecium fluviatile CBS 122367 TaxID=1168545 RepID=A0A6G1ILN9_9PLEO|nr:hypothetical protein K458DRAFT_435305 [Lentithecium fluviatile CBS 122367]